MRAGALALLLMAPPAIADLELKLVQIVFRHGDRSAIHPIPTLPPAGWPQGFGQLTDLGMNQQYEAGSLYRSLYIDEAGLISVRLVPPPPHRRHPPPRSDRPPQPFYDRGEVEVVSTDVERTLMSVESQLAAWFPPVPPNPPLLPPAPSTQKAFAVSTSV